VLIFDPHQAVDGPNQIEHTVEPTHRRPSASIFVETTILPVHC
jgi:hypothetical protein